MKSFLAILGLAIVVLWLVLRSTKGVMRAQDSIFADFIAHASDEYNVPQDWIAAFISQESSWDPNATRFEPKLNESSYGLMQLLESTAKGLGWTGDPKELLDPDLNIHLGTKLLSNLRDQYGNDLTRVASAYNSGHGDYYKTNPQVATYVTELTEKYQQISGGASA